MRRWIRHIIFLILVFSLCLPFIQQNTGFLNEKPLMGMDKPPPWPTFSLKTWADGSFQEAAEKAIEPRVGFRPFLIRLKNQLEFTFFHRANARGVIVGKKRYLYEEDYLRAHHGGDYPGDWFWREKFRRCGMVNDTLLKLGVNLAVIIEPSKATYFEEYIPKHKSIITKEANTNYQSILEGCRDENIALINLNEYFLELKNDIPFPLFPKGGIHWSNYGMLRAMDTLLPFVEERTGKQVPDIVLGPLNPSSKLQGTDGDLAELMNLIVKPRHPQMTYPEVKYVAVADSSKPRVLAISDSFYFNIINAGIPDNCFANTAFWYYNKTIYPETWAAHKGTDMINVRKEVESMDMILVMITERFFYKFAWEFFDQLFEEYFPGAEINYRYKYTNQIISHYVWFDEVVAESAEQGISLEQGLDNHSGYQFWQDEQKGLLKKNQSYYEMKIIHDEAWMEKIREKAAKNGITVERQVQLDAAWTLSNAK